MKDKPTTFGLGHQELARLWRVGEDTAIVQDKPAGEQERAELLRDRLAEPWPPDSAVTHPLPEPLAVVLEQFKPLAGCCVGDLLFDPDADPSVIWQIKDSYKERARSASGTLERDAATVIYYAAIANALLFHEALLRDDKITTFSNEELHKHFSRLLDIPWLTPDLVGLFKKARDA